MPTTQVSEKSKGQRAFEAYSMASVGLEMGVAVLIGGLLGHWLDGRFDTEPFLMLAGLLIGIAAGFKAVYRAAKKAKSLGEESKQ